MPTLMGTLGTWGPIVIVKVMQSPQYVAALKKANRPFATPSNLLGLIDTGASCSALDTRIIALLNLQHRGNTNVITPSTGSAYQVHDQYDASFVLGDGEPNPLVKTLPVISCDLAHQGFFALLGRDILESCVLTYDGPANSFRLDF